jgi:hypothetical protein
MLECSSCGSFSARQEWYEKEIGQKNGFKFFSLACPCCHTPKRTDT